MVATRHRAGWVRRPRGRWGRGAVGVWEGLRKVRGWGPGGQAAEPSWGLEPGCTSRAGHSWVLCWRSERAG